MMVELNERAFALRPSPGGGAVGAGVRRALALQAASRLFDRQQRRAQLRRWWDRLRGRPVGLARLPALRHVPLLAGHRLAGVQPALVARIGGSENRAGDFDAAFRPLSDRTRDRWVGVATHYLLGESLPPVELIQIRERYYVRDGHHRVSVARALGFSHLEAEVLLWTVAAPPGRAALECAAPALARLGQGG